MSGRGRSVVVRAAAKVNLHLGVGGLQHDGSDERGEATFHRLATVYQAVGLYDDLTATDADEWSVHLTADDLVDLTGVPGAGGSPEGSPGHRHNLAVRAGLALAAHHDVDRAARLDVHKGIPVMGGLAGGSADAAAALVALDRLWDLQTPDDDLLALAAGLGSDVPFALLGGTVMGTGRGELVEPVPDVGAWWWVVVGSDRGLSTPAVYRRFDELLGDGLGTRGDPDVPGELLDALAVGEPDVLAPALHNDLEAAALDLRPDLATTMDDGRHAGALAALLSGSGPTVLLLCEDQHHAHAVHRAMAARGHGLLTVVPAPVAGAHLLPVSL